MTDHYIDTIEDTSMDAGDQGSSTTFARVTPQEQQKCIYPDGGSEESTPLSPHPPPPTGESEARPTMSENLRKFKRAAEHVVRVQQIARNVRKGQGVDVSMMDDVYGCIERQLDISVVDTSVKKHCAKPHMNNHQFLEWLKTPRPEWSTVRWINVNGMSWDVIKALALHFDLHHLAVEDMLHVPQRTKVDSYPNQTFLACPLLSLVEETEDGVQRNVIHHDDFDGLDPRMLSDRVPLEKLDRFRQYPQYTKFGNLKVLMEQVIMFFLPNNTLLTFFQVSGHTVVTPLIERLGQDFSMTRRHGDASFLLQAILDAIVDHALPITNAFRQEINEMEQHVLALPAMKYMHGLHRLSRQLSLLRRTVVPTQTLVATLRKKDERSPLTPLARTYLGDVMDHCNTMVEDIDTMLAVCEKLIDLIFNIIAFETNESMKRLAIVSIIFLPITFVAGVYGTNFEHFEELSYGIGYFWKICIACTCVVLACFFFEWIRNCLRAHYIKKRITHDPVSIRTRNRRFSMHLER